MEIHIWWDGPFTFLELDKLNNDKSDKGIYQIYGPHPVYGSGVLLYIGKAGEQTFSKRLSSERKNWEEDNFEQLEIYIGRLAGDETPDAKEWSKRIDIVEKLLIFAHSPAYNYSRKGPINDKQLEDVHIYNWDEYMSLFPEVSGGRWTEKFAEFDGIWKPFGEA